LPVTLIDPRRGKDEPLFQEAEHSKLPSCVGKLVGDEKSRMSLHFNDPDQGVDTLGGFGLPGPKIFEVS
jgi:hypothetical protein